MVAGGFAGLPVVDTAGLLLPVGSSRFEALSDGLSPSSRVDDVDTLLSGAGADDFLPATVAEVDVSESALCDVELLVEVLPPGDEEDESPPSDDPSSAWATPAPVNIAAPTPKVIAPAPSQLYGSIRPRRLAR